MPNNFGQKFQTSANESGLSPKRSGLSLNLHTMPKTITGHLKNWLILGFLILGIFALGSLVIYFISQ